MMIPHARRGPRDLAGMLPADRSAFRLHPRFALREDQQPATGMAAPV